MDLGQIIGMVQQMQGGQGQQAGGAPGGFNLQAIESVAAQFGINPQTAIDAITHMGNAASSGQAETPDQAVEHASRETGVDAGTLAQLVQSLASGGGQGGGVMGMVEGMLDKNKDGSVLDDLAGMAGGLFKR
jgi:hypothetical protein